MIYTASLEKKATNYFGKKGFFLKMAGMTTSEKILETLKKKLIRKSRHVGLSNENPWGVLNILNIPKGFLKRLQFKIPIFIKQIIRSWEMQRYVKEKK
ncbi:MAG: hypothetical protein CM15mP102_03530 [Flavobacteriales bacterium]|nr:MAG: hypothetical protein CM15mP102_03530 [Flavobacteriales bacterium]